MSTPEAVFVDGPLFFSLPSTPEVVFVDGPTMIEPWAEIYNEFGKKPFDTAPVEAKVAVLIQDSEVQKKSGLYQYFLWKN